ncbi:fam-a protein, fragment [Plasmodium vinckei brucechwatti]|uniref:Fam-a protein n=1 Tax=Plasmodium vinckei brucechwatti TaxID=119398 RepID=A0A6V7RW05_PLAVN|nr:fam-a protein, fragment [Plasmodium vinckei brucechwatti]
MNKLYIKVALFLLSLFVYVTNKARASELFLRGDVALNAYSNATVPHGSYFNIAIIRNVVSNKTDRKNTRPKRLIPINDFLFFAISMDHHSNEAIRSNSRPNAAI